jgi:DNA (cytosine-5)-methyltransferase 1
MDTEETNTPNQPNNETMHSNNPIIPYISLCSGYEGIGLGLHRCIPNLRCVAYCEREAFAIANLVAKMESGLLDAAPVFTDVTNFPWADYAPYMAGGILSFGWPCQSVSCAGKRKATEDERWLFDIIADGISILRPGMLFAENVEGLLSARMPDGSSVFGHCIERLESLHYKVAAGIFSASEVGAPHQRKRVFILAHRSGEGFQGREWIGQTRAQGASSGHATECSSSMADSILRGMSGSRNELGDIGEAGQGRPHLEANSHTAWPSRPGEPQHRWEPPRVVGNADHGRLAPSLNARSSTEADRGGQGDIEQAEPRQTQPPLGGDADGTSDWLGYAELSSLCDSELAEIREWMVKCDNRTDELRLLGNGVVWQTAERSFRVLMEELCQEK